MESENEEPPNHFGYAFGAKKASVFDLRKYGSVPEARVALQAEEELETPECKHKESYYNMQMLEINRNFPTKSNIVKWPLGSRLTLAARTRYEFNGPASAGDDHTGQNMLFQDWAVTRFCDWKRKTTATTLFVRV